MARTVDLAEIRRSFGELANGPTPVPEGTVSVDEFLGALELGTMAARARLRVSAATYMLSGAHVEPDGVVVLKAAPVRVAVEAS